VPTVLIVEDDDMLRESVRDLLRDHGFETAEAIHGRAALDYLQTNPPPCVVLLDLMMPVMNGWDFMAAVLRGQPSPIPPIVVTSAMADHAPSGAAAVLRKPFDLDELVEIVRRHCAA
jgi:CheY-like chemotaxis protein